MYGDTDVMRKHAGRLREQGEEIRALADQLVAQAETLHWSGRAGDAMRERVRERAARLREAAARHETRGRLPREPHRAEVDGLKDAIADTERRQPGRCVADGALLDGFEPPRARPQGLARRSPCPASGRA